MTDAKHVLVAGPSGGGKTTYLGEMHARHDGPSVFLSTHEGDQYPEDIARARQAIADAGGGQVIVDEAQNAPTFLSGEYGPVATMLHEDRKRDIKCVIATQNPQDLHTSERRYGPLQQCEYFVWVGPAKTWHKGFRNWLNLDVEQLPERNYQYVVIDPADPPVVVDEGETDPSFHPGGQ